MKFSISGEQLAFFPQRVRDFDSSQPLICLDFLKKSRVQMTTLFQIFGFSWLLTVFLIRIMDLWTAELCRPWYQSLWYWGEGQTWARHASWLPLIYIPVLAGAIWAVAALSRNYFRLRNRALPLVGRLSPQARRDLACCDLLWVLRLLFTICALGVGIYYWHLLIPFPLILGLCLLYVFVIVLQYSLFFLPWELILYLIFGGFTTLVSVVSFTALDALLNGEGNGSYDWIVPKILSFILAILFAYITNRRYVFHSREPVGGEFFRFVLSRLFSSLLFEGGGLFLCINLFHWEKQISNLLVACLVVVVNYILSKISVFRTEGGFHEKL